MSTDTICTAIKMRLRALASFINWPGVKKRGSHTCLENLIFAC